MAEEMALSTDRQTHLRTPMRRRKRHFEKPTGPREAARLVLETAAHTPDFRDLCEAERLIWLIERGYTLGTNAGKSRTAKCVREAAIDGNRRERM